MTKVKCQIKPKTQMTKASGYRTRPCGVKPTNNYLVAGLVLPFLNEFALPISHVPCDSDNKVNESPNSHCYKNYRTDEKP
jgi:hypothetical protein